MLGLVEQEQPAEIGSRDYTASATGHIPDTAEILQIAGVADCSISCEAPSAYGLPISHWKPREVWDEAIKRGIVSSISPQQDGRFF